jgi:hypothetical protein
LIALLSPGIAVAQPAPPTAAATPSASKPTPPPDGRRPKKDHDHDPGDRDSGRRPPLPPLDHAGPGDQGGQDGPLARFKKKMDQMSPEEREHFQENWKRWKQMGDGERKDWQQRAMDERERIKKVIDDTISKLGLKLDDDQREVFVLRYRQERRKIEEQLRSEMDAKRQAEVNEMLQRLKVEFSTPKPAPAPAPAKPAATP